MTNPPSPQQIAQNAFNSTVSLESETINGERIPLGKWVLCKRRFDCCKLT